MTHSETPEGEREARNRWQLVRALVGHREGTWADIGDVVRACEGWEIERFIEGRGTDG